MYKKLFCILILGLSSQITLSQPEELVFDGSASISRLYKLGDILYYTTGQDVRFIDLNDSSFTPQILISNLNVPAGITHKEGFLYVAEWGAGKVIKLDLNQANPSSIDVILSAGTPNDLLFIGDVLYFSANQGNRIYKYDVNSGTQSAETAVNIPGPIGLELKDGRLYISVPLADTIHSIDIIDENAELETLIENEPNMDHPINLEFYNNELYIANRNSDNILKANIDNEPYDIVEILTLNGVKDLVIDQGIIYYCNSAFIYRVDLSSLSVDDLTHNKIRLYPNPTKNEINISNLHNSKSFQLYDSIGRIIKEGVLEPLGKLDVSDLKAGFYFIKIKDEDEALRFLKI